MVAVPAGLNPFGIVAGSSNVVGTAFCTHRSAEPRPHWSDPHTKSATSQGWPGLPTAESAAKQLAGALMPETLDLIRHTVIASSL